MAANKKFTPRASSNLIEEEVTENKEAVETEAPVEDKVETVVAPENEEGTEASSETVVKEEAKDETPEAPVEDKSTDEVTFTAKTEKKPIERMVKVRLAKKYDGCIGGQWYHFAKDQVVTVPENVKRILNSAEGMLKPL
ncbi:MAG: hypothetical protein IKB72_01430 [Ruminococcus sp.]|nr:hypothetical protein [Ruminococcus sp.]